MIINTARKLSNKSKKLTKLIWSWELEKLHMQPKIPISCWKDPTNLPKPESVILLYSLKTWSMSYHFHIFVLCFRKPDCRVFLNKYFSNFWNDELRGTHFGTSSEKNENLGHSCSSAIDKIKYKRSSVKEHIAIEIIVRYSAQWCRQCQQNQAENGIRPLVWKVRFYNFLSFILLCKIWK